MNGERVGPKWGGARTGLTDHFKRGKPPRQTARMARTSGIKSQYGQGEQGKIRADEIGGNGKAEGASQDQPLW